jgi:hypothetical protein
VYSKITRTKSACTDRYIYQFTKTNFDEVGYHLDSLNLEEVILRNVHNIDQAWTEWNNNVLEVINKFVPRVKLKTSHTKPWIDGDVLHQSKMKERLRRIAKKTKKTSDWDKYRKANNDLKKLINKKYSSFIDITCEDLNVNPKRFWGLASTKSGDKGSLPNEMEYNGAKSNDAEVIAGYLNQHFHNSFNTNEYTAPGGDTFVNNNLSNILFSPIEVKEIMNKLNANKAYNVGGIPTKIFKECASVLCSSLSLLFNLSLRVGKIPTAWKQADVIPIYKKGAKTLVNNYRPISLLCIASKILERCIYNHIYPITCNDIHKDQHGFMPLRSTVTNL